MTFMADAPVKGAGIKPDQEVLVTTRQQSTAQKESPTRKGTLLVGPGHPAKYPTQRRALEVGVISDGSATGTAAVDGEPHRH
jgi:hypothetical protein